MFWKVERSIRRAVASGTTGQKIERQRPALRFVKYAEVLITQAQVQDEIRFELDLVLHESELLRLTHALERERRKHGGRIQEVVLEIGNGSVRQRRGGRVAFVHLDAANFHAGLDDVLALYPIQGVDPGKCGPILIA